VGHGRQRPVRCLLNAAWTRCSPRAKGTTSWSRSAVCGLTTTCCGKPNAVFASVLELLDRYDKHAAEHDTDNEYAPGWDLIAAAALVARTPGPPLPDPDTLRRRQPDAVRKEP
jgi:hypothetical protein